VLAAGLAAAVCLTGARAAELRTIAKSLPAPPPKAACGNHGTSVHFVDTPSEAARQARKEKKLVFVLHVSGLFEDPKLT
jgi:hypothetical protein